MGSPSSTFSLAGLNPWAVSLDSRARAGYCLPYLSSRQALSCSDALDYKGMTVELECGWSRQEALRGAATVSAKTRGLLRDVYSEDAVASFAQVGAVLVNLGHVTSVKGHRLGEDAVAQSLLKRREGF